MKFTFTVLLVLGAFLPSYLLSQNSTDGSLSNFEFLENRLESTREYTLLVMEAMPEKDYDFQPAEEVMSYRELALHIVRSIEWNLAVMKGKSIKWRDGDHMDFSPADLKNYGEEQFAAWFEFLKKSKTKPELTDKVIDVLNHNAHHRGQMVTYLRLKGIEPPAYR